MEAGSATAAASHEKGALSFFLRKSPRTAPQLSFVIGDHLGYPEMVIDTNGTVTWTADHLPFGQVYAETGSENDPGLRYPGQWTIPEAEMRGLPEMYYNWYRWYRWYRGGWGRYTQSDPIGLEGGVNLFVYVSNNPVNSFDQDGLMPNSIRCFYWGRKCARHALDCANFWRCELASMGTEEMAGFFDRVSETAGRPVNTQDGFLHWFCFLTLDECKKAIKYCGTAAVKPSFGGKPS